MKKARGSTSDGVFFRFQYAPFFSSPLYFLFRLLPRQREAFDNFSLILTASLNQKDG